jgi:hypothetical protein
MLLGQRRVFQVGQPGFRRQEQVPQAGGFGLGFQFLDDRRGSVIVWTGFLAILVILGLGGEDVIGDELAQSLVVVAGFG